MINARKINDEKNIFEGFFTNRMFAFVWIIIILGQVLIVEVGSGAMSVSPGGLPWQHWLIAIICGLFAWVWAFILKMVPDTMCP